MVLLFTGNPDQIVAVHVNRSLPDNDIQKLEWLFSGAELLQADSLDGYFVGPRREMITPWSTNAVEITQNMGIEGILRIEEFFKVDGPDAAFDPMLQIIYQGIDQDTFTINKMADDIITIDDIAGYNEKEGLALSDDEIDYLNELSHRLGRKLSDSEVLVFLRLTLNTAGTRFLMVHLLLMVRKKEALCFS
jgi:phosphoribosylformylglycinamidine synthase